MTLTGLALSLVLTIGQGPPTLDVGGYLELTTDLPLQVLNSCGASIPHINMVSDAPVCPYQETREHEVVHQRQYEALGPALPLVFAATLGKPFEDYLDPGLRMGRGYGYGHSYMYDPGWTNRCPAATITSEGIEFMPCWRF